MVRISLQGLPVRLLVSTLTLQHPPPLCSNHTEYSVPPKGHAGSPLSQCKGWFLCLIPTPRFHTQCWTSPLTGAPADLYLAVHLSSSFQSLRSPREHVFVHQRLLSPGTQEALYKHLLKESKTFYIPIISNVLFPILLLMQPQITVFFLSCHSSL